MQFVTCRGYRHFVPLHRCFLRPSVLPLRLRHHGMVACTSHTDPFYSESSFESFPLAPSISTALTGAGYNRPSQIQGLGMGKILEGKDVLLAAETGSGKTLAYLLPLITNILHEKSQLEEAEEKFYDEMRVKKQRHRFALILCPSMDLCRQIEGVLKSLNLEEGLIKVEVSPAGLSRYRPRPDILLGTPGSVLTTLLGMGKEIPHQILARVGYVVVDEADLMLAGSYRRDIDRLLQMMKFCERELAARHLASILNIQVDEFYSLPRLIRKAGVEDGLQGMIEAGYKAQNLDSVQDNSKTFWKKQYILAGATIPSLGTKNIRDEIQQLFPRVEIITTSNLHRPTNQLEYQWVEIDPEDRMEALKQTIEKDKEFENGVSGKILIFTQNSTTAESTSRFLESHELNCVAYHKKMIGVERSSNLEKFRLEQGIVMVSTDGMSRGMDIPDITHIIQSHFAPSAITFVHRVGRTGRAGKRGKVTSFCTEEDKDLVEAIRDCMDENLPIEGAFSRNRSFRKKFRRYGRFIPRGNLPSEVISKNTTSSRKECTELECPI